MNWYLVDDMMTNPPGEAPRKWVFLKSENDDTVTITIDGETDDLIDEVLALVLEDRTPPLEIRTHDELRDMGLFKPKTQPKRLRLVDGPSEVDGEQKS